MAGECKFNTATYYDAIVAANQSGGCIDLAESKRLFESAHACNVSTSGDDGVQGLYKQITGIENDTHGSKDTRITAGGYFKTYFGENHPIFKEGQFFANGKNACINFDSTQTERRTICEPDLTKQPDTLEVAMTNVPIHWCDAIENGTPYHVNARNGAFATRDETKNWRVLLNNNDDAAKPLVSAGTALDMVQKNLPYPAIVTPAIRLGVESSMDPSEVSKFAADVLDTLVAARNIDESVKIEYANIVNTYVTDRFKQIPFKYREFRLLLEAYFGKTLVSFQASIQTKPMLGKKLENNYYKDGVGYWHGTANTLAITIGAGYVVPFIAKTGWAASAAMFINAVRSVAFGGGMIASAAYGIAEGTAVAGAAFTAAPVAITVATVAIVVVAISWLAVKVWSWSKEEDEHEKQYHEKVERYEIDRSQ